MRQSSDQPLTKEEQYAANLAMAARKETEEFKSRLTENLRLKMWCIERSIEVAKAAVVMYIDDGENLFISDMLARKLYQFLTETEDKK